MINRVVVFILITTLPLLALGQNLIYTKASKKALAYYENANNYLSSSDYSKAQMELNKAIKDEPKFVDALFLSADIHYYKNEFPQAKAKYLKANSLSNALPNVINFKIGNCAFNSNGFREAKNFFTKYLEGKTSEKKKIIAEELLANCEFAISAKANPVNFKPVLFKAISSESDDFPPSLTADEKTIIFTRKIGSGNSSNEDLYFSEYKASSNRYASFHDNWAEPKPLSNIINSVHNEGAHASTADGKTIIFTACDRPDSYGNCDIYLSKNINENWTKPVNLGPKINSAFWDSQPSISADGNMIYFASNRKGGFGGADLYYSKYDVIKKEWGKPVNLGPTVNTEKWEITPFIHPDGQTLYFASNGHSGIGGYDLFVTTSLNENNWITPENLGYPLNSTGDEMDLYVSNDGKRAFYSSNGLKNKIGGLDIYYFDLPEDKRAKLVTYVKGVVTDEKTEKPIASIISLVDLATGQEIQNTTSDRITGEYLVVLPSGKDYSLTVERKEYLIHSENFSLKSELETNKPFQLAVALKPIMVNESIVLKNVFFEVDSFVLDKRSFPELKRLIDILYENPTLRFEIGGHTDRTGSEDYNLMLSKKRAESVVNYLVSKGIDSNRLVAKGYGSTQPVNRNNSTRSRALNRRTEFKIIH